MPSSVDELEVAVRGDGLDEFVGRLDQIRVATFIFTDQLLGLALCGEVLGDGVEALLLGYGDRGPQQPFVRSIPAQESVLETLDVLPFAAPTESDRGAGSSLGPANSACR